MTHPTDILPLKAPKSRASTTAPFRLAKLLLVALAMLFAGDPAVGHSQESTPWKVADVRLGFRDLFKLGCWTQLTVTFAGGSEPHTGTVEVGAADADGVSVAYALAPDSPLGLLPGRAATASLLVRIGQQYAPLSVRFRSEDGKVRAQRSFDFGYERAEGSIPYPQTSTTRLLLSIGPAATLAEVVRSEREDDENPTRAVALVDPSDMPLSWEGYESVDTVQIASGAADFFRDLPAQSPRLTALEDWVRRGGNIVLLGDENSQETLAPGGALAALVPGEFVNLARLRDATPLETFSNSSDSLARGRFDARVPRIGSVRGKILAYAGATPTELPLVVRAREGLGQVTFCAVDPNVDPFDAWSGRQSLQRRLLGWPLIAVGQDETTHRARGEGYLDLANQLRGALDVQFAGVKTAPFGLVVLLVVLYIALIGPGDYLFVQRVLKRMEATWITFPLIVAIVSVGAYGLARWFKGDQLRVNHVEVVDVDMSSDTAYGTVWTHFFSPRVERYNLRLAPQLGKTTLPKAQCVTAWMGSPGQGLGGMQGEGGQGMFDRGYAGSPLRDALLGLPVQEWSTKTITARWSGHVEAGIDADLRLVRDELLAGTVTNRLGVDLEDSLLLHGHWAYRLTDLPDGVTRRIDESAQPRSVRTLLTNAAAGDDRQVQAAEDGTVAYQPYSHDVARLVKVMMFYDAVGGQAYASAMHRYQSFVDMSRLLEGDQAILVARAPPTSRSTWINGEVPLTSPHDARWVFYRFVIPLKGAEPTS